MRKCFALNLQMWLSNTCDKDMQQRKHILQFNNDRHCLTLNQCTENINFTGNPKHLFLHQYLKEKGWYECILDNIYTNTDKSDKSMNSRAVSVMIKKNKKNNFSEWSFQIASYVHWTVQNSKTLYSRLRMTKKQQILCWNQTVFDIAAWKNDYQEWLIFFWSTYGLISYWLQLYF